MNFAGHSLVGLFAGALAALAVAAVAPRTSMVSVPLAVPTAVLVLVYLGSVYPDVDLHGSIPRRRLLPYLQAAAVGGVTFSAAVGWDVYVAVGRGLLRLFGVAYGPLFAGGVTLLAVAGAAVLAVEPVLDGLTGAHRTRTHSVLLHGLGAGAVSLAVWVLAPVGGADGLVLAGLPFAFVLGVAVHHLADDVG